MHAHKIRALNELRRCCDVLRPGQIIGDTRRNADATQDRLASFTRDRLRPMVRLWACEFGPERFSAMHSNRSGRMPDAPDDKCRLVCTELYDRMDPQPEFASSSEYTMMNSNHAEAIDNPLDVWADDGGFIPVTLP
jgi:hypothetical protein